MIYDLSNTEKLQEAADLLAEWGGLGKTIEIKVYREKRTNPQNRALYLLLGYLSNETGYTLDEAKQLYKEMNKDIYRYFKPTKDGEDIKFFIKSSADLNSEEMAKSIDTMYKVCEQNGITLPLLTNEVEMLSIQNEIERNRMYN